MLAELLLMDDNEATTYRRLLSLIVDNDTVKVSKRHNNVLKYKHQLEIPKYHQNLMSFFQVLMIDMIIVYLILKLMLETFQ